MNATDSCPMEGLHSREELGRENVYEGVNAHDVGVEEEEEEEEASGGRSDKSQLSAQVYCIPLYMVCSRQLCLVQCTSSYRH